MGYIVIIKMESFNVPMVSHKSPTIYDENNLRGLSKLIKDVNFQYVDYKKVWSMWWKIHLYISTHLIEH